MSQLNFAEIKQRISIVQGAKFLGLTLKKDGATLRCACPVCDGDERTLSLLEENNVFKCFQSQFYGSVLDLVCHVKGIGLREAGKWLNEQESKEWTDEFSGDDEEVGEKPLLKPLAKLPKLDPNHDAVKALGFKPGLALELGVGFASAGLLRGYIGIPLYLDGEVVGYIGLPKDATIKLPKNIRGEA